MAVELGSVDHLTQVISQVVAPSFLLGAVASFASVLFMRMTNILERLRKLRSLPESGHDHSFLRADVPRLQWRAQLVNAAIFLTVCSGAIAALLIILAFASAYMGLQHVWIAAVLFMISLTLLAGALVTFAIEVLSALREHDQHHL
jgi:uncharacterized protein DUF2721